jgi:hypothetical protein
VVGFLLVLALSFTIMTIVGGGTAVAAPCDRTLSVRSGAPVEVFNWGFYSTKNCQSAPRLPQYSVRDKPKGGKVSSKIVKAELSAKAGRCAGRKIRFKTIFYTSKKGFRGTDSFSIRTGAYGRTNTCKITVRVR